jgi:hypothetical protein
MVRVERGDDDLAHIARRDRITGAGADDFNQREARKARRS